MYRIDSSCPSRMFRASLLNHVRSLGLVRDYLGGRSNCCGNVVSYSPPCTAPAAILVRRARQNALHHVANMPRYGLLFAGSYSYSAGQVTEGFRRIRRLSDGLTQGRLVSFSCLYITRLDLYFLGSKLSSTSINYITDTYRCA
jgi:hypothetical protein